MTSLPPSTLSVAVEAGTASARLRVAGDLDYDTGDELIQHARGCLDAHPELHDLHLDFADLRFCDSTGLSALLMVHRTTTAANIRLHLDNPPDFLERILATTGVRRLFLPAPPSQRAE